MTKDCRKMQLALAGKLDRGEIDDLVFDDDDSNESESNVPKRERSGNNRFRKTRKKRYGSSHNAKDPAPSEKKGKQVKEIEETPPPEAAKRIQVILGGYRYYQQTINSIKAHQRRADNNASRTSFGGPEATIAFNESKMNDLHGPHDEALVLTLQISNCEVSRILIDNGSAADAIFIDTLLEMGIDPTNVEKVSVPLTGFNGNTINTLGSIKLLVYADGVNKITNLLVIDCLSPIT